MRPRFRDAVLLAALLAGPAWAPSAAAQRPPARVCDMGALRARLASDPGRVSIADGRISLLVPAGMRALSPSEIPARFSFGQPGADALTFGSGEGAAVVVMRMPPDDSPSEANLASPEFRGVFTRLVQLAVPGVELRSESVVRDGARWLRIVPARAGGSSRGYAAMYITTFQGTGLMALFLANDPLLAAAVARSAASLEVSDCALPPGAPAEPRSVLAAAAPTCDRGELDARLAAEPRRVAAYGGRVSLVPPDGMLALSPAEIARMKLDSPPEIVLYHQDALATVRLTGDAGLVDMPRYREALERMLRELHPELVWHGHEMVEAGGARWLKVAYTRSTNGRERRVTTYLTAFRGQTLIVDLAANVAVAPRWEAALAGAMGALELRDCELPGQAER